MRKKTQAAAFAAGAVGLLLFGCALALLFPGVCTLFVAAGFVAYVACFRKAVILWHLDEQVFEHPHRFVPPRKHFPRLIAIVILAAAAVPVLAQQTIFNVPSADVLDKGKTYLELDVLGRPQDPNFAVFTGRGVYGFGRNIEAGVNFGGFLVPGRSVPIATPNIKWRPWHNDELAFTTGVFGLFYLRGSRDGDPAVLWYGEGSYKLPTNTRLTAGGYWASSGYAAKDPQAGALIGLEQKINDHLNVIADWISGENGLAYFTPGISVPLGAWTIYAGYSLKNGDSKGNAALLEFGLTF